MRLILFCIVLFLAPAGCLVVTDRFVNRIEDDFFQDAQWHITRYDRIVEMYPPKARTIRNAAEIRQLKQLGDPHGIASGVCGPMDSPYKRLFDRLSIRCGEWSVLRRARNAALVGVAIAFCTLALVLVARIGVRGYERNKEWAGSWTAWFSTRGIQAVLLIQVTTALAGFAVLLRTLLSHPLYAYAALVIPWLGLFWIERLTAAGFTQAPKIFGNRPRRRARVMRARA